MPINISSATAEKCTSDCDLSFDYQVTNLVAENDGSMILLQIDPVKTPPVVFNKVKFTPIYGMLMCMDKDTPVSTLNGVNPSAMIWIIHIFNDGNGHNSVLIMMIPIIESSDNQTTSSQILTDIINQTCLKAPKIRDNSKIAISDFSFQSIFPTNSPFFVWRDNNGASSIIFENAIAIDKSVLDNLNKIIPPQPFKGGDTSQTKIYYNPNGASTIALIKDEEIYIDCQPVSTSKESIEYVTKNPFNNDLSTILNDPTTLLILQIILSSVVFIVIYFILSKGFQYMTTGKIPQIIPTNANVGK